MNKNDIRRLDMLVRVDQFGEDHPLLPVNTRVTALLGSIKTVITQVRTLVGSQESGRGQFRGGASERRRLAKSLRKAMRKIADIAAVLDPATYPGAREEFRMPRTRAYQDLQNRAQAFMSAVGPIKAAFIERDLPADFEEQLSGVLAEFMVATQTKESGRISLVEGTAGITAATQGGVRLVRELGAILRVRYENNPGLLAAFKSAAHIERASLRQDAVAASGTGTDTGTSTAGSASTGNGLVTVAPSGKSASGESSPGHADNGASQDRVLLAEEITNGCGEGDRGCRSRATEWCCREADPTSFACNVVAGMPQPVRDLRQSTLATPGIGGYWLAHAHS